MWTPQIQPSKLRLHSLDIYMPQPRDPHTVPCNNAHNYPKPLGQKRANSTSQSPQGHTHHKNIGTTHRPHINSIQITTHSMHPHASLTHNLTHHTPHTLLPHTQPYAISHFMFIHGRSTRSPGAHIPQWSQSTPSSLAPPHSQAGPGGEQKPSSEPPPLPAGVQPLCPPERC